MDADAAPARRPSPPRIRYAPLGYSALYLLFWLIAPRIPDARMLTVVASTIVSLTLLVLVTAATARALQSTWSALTLAVLAAAASVPLRALYAMNLLIPPWAWLLKVPGAPDLAFVLLGAAVGVLLSRLLRSANMIPPAAAALAVVDIWTVLLGGPVQNVMQRGTQQAQRTVEAMTVRLPAPTTGAAPIAVVGFADFLFMAFFVAALCRFAGDKIGYRRTVPSLIVLLSAYMVVVLVTGWSLPALVPMAVVVVALHWRQFRYERSELFAMLYAAILVVALIAAGVFLLR